ncbi:MAG TPA: OB-fold domain-containing protein [Streptosporangiaceae bacterium]|nr:OB-fold domain-containing protein [Streptosporangiaceae bacterium]
MNSAAIQAAADRVRAAGPGSPRLARDPVNLPVIRAWTDAIGDANPVYTDAEFAAESVHGGLVAPPAMIQVWTMPGLRPPPSGGDDPLGVMTAELDAAGFTSVVATNCDQAYARYLRPGEQLAVRAELLDVTGPKRTALGEGWFVTTRSTWYSGEEPVATMDFRVLKFRPHSEPERAGPGGRPPGTPRDVMRPPLSPDTEFFWTGTRQGELRIQRCGGCGALRHPPGPACPRCGSIGKAEYQVATGTGTVFSYVVHHHPPVPGKELPIIVALVELTEGVRMLGELTGIDPGDVRIGMPVRASLDRVADDPVLPGWRPDEPGALPELRVDVTPTFVVATALATRDFYPAHHDRDLAVQRGSKDIFLNILTTTGLVQRYVTDWAGPDAIVRAVSIRLGVPCYANDALTFAGTMAETPGGERLVAVTGTCSLGDHVTGTVRLAPPGSTA